MSDPRATLRAEQQRAAAHAAASLAVDREAAARSRSPLEHRLAEAGNDDLVACLGEGAARFRWETAARRGHEVDRRYRRGVALAASSDSGLSFPLATFIDVVVDADTGITNVLRVIVAYAAPSDDGSAAMQHLVEAGTVQGIVHALRSEGDGQSAAGWTSGGLVGAGLVPSILDMPEALLVPVPTLRPLPAAEAVREAALLVAASSVIAAVRDASGLDDPGFPLLAAQLLPRIFDVAAV